MKSRYQRQAAAESVSRLGGTWGEALALRVYTSRLLGAEPGLVLHGGGNTSVKGRATELSGDDVDVLFVKGSGWDLATIEPAGFPACRLGALRRLCALSELSDEAMVKALRGQMLDPASPTPSVEALLHALLPARFVDHTHADAVLAVVDQPDSQRRAEEIWGERLVFVPYVMPGFALARAVAERAAELELGEVMVLDKHGIFTWGDTAEHSYERMIAAVSAAESHVASAPRLTSVPAQHDAGERQRRQRELSPLVRGALARANGGARFLLSWRDEPEIIALCEHAEAARATRAGTITPDHVIRIKPWPAWLPDGATPGDIDRVIDEYGAAYGAYVDRCAAARGRDPVRLDPLPRVLLAPGLGALCVGATVGDATIAGDVYAHNAGVILDALRLGSFQPVGELELFDVEYWSLEQAKLALGAKATGPLSRHVALVTGAAGGIGRATAEHLLALGAHVLVSDVDPERLTATAAALSQKFGARVKGFTADVTDETAVAALFDAVIDAFGGVDVVVSNAGNAPSGLLHTDAGDDALSRSLELNFRAHQRVARAATRVLLAQGSGGCLLFNASKSAFNQGPEFGPYAVPKAALVALMKQYAVDLGPHGIRACAVNADRIRTDLFGGGVLEARAKARGVSPDAYFRENLLRRETLAGDVAQAFGYLATAAATTGLVVTVDGGNAAAFPR